MSSKRCLTAAVVSLLLSLGLIFPVGAQEFATTLPEPTGSPVGFSLVTVVDEAREEVFTAEEGGYGKWEPLIIQSTLSRPATRQKRALQRQIRAEGWERPIPG